MDFIANETSNKRLEPAPGVLYIVGTPIGNLGDFSPRAISLLKSVSTIACEDTRHSGQLLKRVGIKANLLSFHKHNTKSRIPQLLKLLDQGKSLALISDAGLPLINDPGEELVQASKEKEHEVICIPGPCAATTALVSSGLPCQRFCFEGFLPSKGRDRKKALETIAKENRTTVIYESPHKLLKLLEELSLVCGYNRPLEISRELTKRYEQSIGPTIGSALEYFKKNKPQGEFTLVLGRGIEGDTNEERRKELKKQIEELIAKGMSPSEASRKISKESGYSRRLLYSMIHKDKDIKSQ